MNPGRNFIPEIGLAIKHYGPLLLPVYLPAYYSTVNKIQEVKPFVIGKGSNIFNRTAALYKFLQKSFRC